MSTMVPMYGFGGGGGTGATLTVTAPSGCTVTVSKDGKAKTKTAGADGVAVFKGLATGQWTVTITDGEQTAQKTVTITADYSTAITFFSATIHVTYPAGSTCTATDGVTTLTAPDTSGTWDCVVPNAGVWKILINGSEHYVNHDYSVNVTGNGTVYNAYPSHILINGSLYPGYESIDRRYGSGGAKGSAGFENGKIVVNAPAATESLNLGYFVEPIDVTKFTKCTMDLMANGWNGSWYGFANSPQSPGITAGSYQNGWVIFGRVADTGFTETYKTVTIDLSGQSGNLYLMFGCAGTSSGKTGTIEATRILFE